MTNKDKQQIDEQLLLSAAKQTLEDSVKNIDAETLERLSAIRLQTLAAASSRKTRGTSWLMPAGGFVTAAALVAAVMLWTAEPVVQETTPVAVIEDLNILTDSEEIDFYQDLEFYQWLAVNEQSVS